jgi:hypothetical protein
MEGFVKQISKEMHKSIYGDEEHLAAYKDENELEVEDSDCKAERKNVYAINKDQYN